MAPTRSLRRFTTDVRALTGAERALLICFGLGIVLVAGGLLHGGSGQAAKDAARTLQNGTASLLGLPTTTALRETQLIHAGGPVGEPAALRAPGPVAAPGAAAEAPPPLVPGTLTLGDTAAIKRTFTDKLYQRNLTTAGQAKVNLTDPAMKSELVLFQRNWAKNHARYEAVAAKTGVPAELIAAIHWREASGNFNTYLHQGDPLGKPARHVPRNIPVFTKWEDAAVHALNMKKSIKTDLGMTDKTTDVAAMATYAEYYNGLGYYNKGRISPYVYSGTDQYSKGKYVADGVYDPNVRDRQLGVVTMLKSITTQSTGGPVASPPEPPPPPQAPPPQAPPPQAPPPPQGRKRRSRSRRTPRALSRRTDTTGTY